MTKYQTSLIIKIRWQCRSLYTQKSYVGLKLAQSLWRWPNIKPASGQ